ncbi:MAG: amidohydrolase family protein [Candidatus Binatia bacterium]
MIVRLRAGLALAMAVACACARPPDLVRRPAERPAALLLSNVRVVDVVVGAILEDRDVLVRGERIEKIAHGGSVEPPLGAQRIDGRERTLVPGYVDMHAHVGSGSSPSWKRRLPDPETNLRALLYCGVTTVLDPAGLSTTAFDLRDRVARGELLGPRQFAAGPIITASGAHPAPVLQHLAPWWLRWYLIPRFTKQVSTANEGRAAVGEIAGYGADVVKVVVDRIPPEAPLLSPEIVEAVVAEARSRGLRTVAHIGSYEDARVAAEAGVAAWVHGVYKERLSDEAVARLASYRIPMVATMVVFESYATLRDPPRRPTALEVDTVEPAVLSAFDEIPPRDPAIEFFREYLDDLEAMRSAWRGNVRRLHEAGVTILAGSDIQTAVFPGPGLHREFALLGEAGLPPIEVLRAATLHAARFLDQSEDPGFGIVAEGKRADLVLLRGNPLADVAALSQIEAVIHRGVLLERIARVDAKD